MKAITFLLSKKNGIFIVHFKIHCQRLAPNIHIPCDIRLCLKRYLWPPSFKCPVWFLSCNFKHYAMRNTFQQSKYGTLSVWRPGALPDSQPRVGKKATFPQFFLILLDFLSSFLNFSSFSSSIWGSGWASRPPGKALATPLVEIKLCRPKNTYAYQIKDISGLHRWIFFIFSPIINRTIGLKII